jgi:hypothetical protein
MLSRPWQRAGIAKTARMSHALPADLPHTLTERLRAEGVATLEEWVALGRRRRQIFGITRAVVDQLDARAKAALRPKP